MEGTPAEEAGLKENDIIIKDEQTTFEKAKRTAKFCWRLFS